MYIYILKTMKNSALNKALVLFNPVSQTSLTKEPLSYNICLPRLYYFKK